MSIARISFASMLLSMQPKKEKFDNKYIIQVGQDIRSARLFCYQVLLFFLNYLHFLYTFLLSLQKI